MSVKPPKTQKTTLAGPVGSLEAILETPATGEPLGAAVVCHPHPQYGGTMHNKVVHTLARSFVRLGYATLRFNFRGTGGSDGEYDKGVGELDDARAALHWVRAEFAAGPLWLAGFSFGAAIALRAAIVEPVDGLITVAPAVSRFASGLEQQPQCPWLVVQGDADELVDIEETISWFNELKPGPELTVVAGAEHFFHGRLIDLRTIVTEFVQEKTGDSLLIDHPGNGE
jgi:alpha/beta superfamily hydrolase